LLSCVILRVMRVPGMGYSFVSAEIAVIFADPPAPSSKYVVFKDGNRSELGAADIGVESTVKSCRVSRSKLEILKSAIW